MASMKTRGHRKAQLNQDAASASIPHPPHGLGTNSPEEGRLSAQPVSGSLAATQGPGQEKTRKRPVRRQRGDEKDKPVAMGGRAWLSQPMTGWRRRPLHSFQVQDPISGIEILKINYLNLLF